MKRPIYKQHRDHRLPIYIHGTVTIEASLFYMYICCPCSPYQVLEAFAKAEKVKKPNPEEVFHDVYAELPKHLQQQLADMKAHLKQYKDHYPLDMFEEMKL